jgi:CheY-like chemotaxis protein
VRSVEKIVLPNIQIHPSISIKKKAILIIDDSDDLLDIQKTILEMDNFEVFTALSGTEALKILTQIDPPDLILLDVLMGDMSGPDFLVQLEEKMPKIMNDVPVVFLTGMENIPIEKVVGLIKKPFDPEIYLEAVHRFIDMKKPSTIRH